LKRLLAKNAVSIILGFVVSLAMLIFSELSGSIFSPELKISGVCCSAILLFANLLFAIIVSIFFAKLTEKPQLINAFINLIVFQTVLFSLFYFMIKVSLGAIDITFINEKIEVAFKALLALCFLTVTIIKFKKPITAINVLFPIIVVALIFRFNIIELSFFALYYFLIKFVPKSKKINKAFSKLICKKSVVVYTVIVCILCVSFYILNGLLWLSLIEIFSLFICVVGFVYMRKTVEKIV